MNITVIGAGIVGLTTAWYLQRDGHRVTVVDRREHVGLGSVGGQLSYRYVAPLADPEILARFPAGCCSATPRCASSPASIPPSGSGSCAFQACNSSDKLRSVAALLPLSLYSQRLIHDLVDKDGFEFDYRQNGKLIIHRQRRSFEAARTLLQKHRELSEFQQALDRDACLALEPSLLRIAERIAGGIHTASEEAGDCYKLCQELAERLARGPSPVCFRLGEAASGFEVAGGGVRAVITSGGPIRGDACVIAGGAEVGRLLAPLGIRVPVFPLKGYSISLPINDPLPAFRRPASPIINARSFTPASAIDCASREWPTSSASGRPQWHPDRHAVARDPRNLWRWSGSIDRDVVGRIASRNPDRTAGGGPRPDSKPVAEHRPRALDSHWRAAAADSSATRSPGANARSRAQSSNLRAQPQRAAHVATTLTAAASSTRSNRTGI